MTHGDADAIILRGTVATDTHQQERETVKIIARVEGVRISGNIGTAFGSTYWEDPEPEHGMEPFHGVEIAATGGDVRTYRIVMDGKAFVCHRFTAKEFFLDIGQNGGALYERPGERPVELFTARKG